MATVINGPFTWSMERDNDGHRIYTIIHRVVSDTTADGPYNVLNTPGLPEVGSEWLFDNDYDFGAICRYDAKVTPDVEGEPGYSWKVQQTFDTKPQTHCYDQPGTGTNNNEINNPLLEPRKISGTFTKKRKEAVYDRFGDPVENSAFEMLRGPNVEFDVNYPTVRIEQNVAELQLSLLAELIDKVNEAPMWGLPARCVKLSNVSWEKKYHGQCEIYFTRILEFDIDYNTFDRDVPDEGTKVLRGHWDTEEGSPTYGQYLVDADADYLNPKDYIRFTDPLHNPCRVRLNGYGVPFDTDETTPGTADDIAGLIHIEYYGQDDLFQLDIPTDLES